MVWKQNLKIALVALFLVMSYLSLPFLYAHGGGASGLGEALLDKADESTERDAKYICGMTLYLVAVNCNLSER